MSGETGDTDATDGDDIDDRQLELARRNGWRLTGSIEGKKDAKPTFTGTVELAQDEFPLKGFVDFDSEGNFVVSAGPSLSVSVAGHPVDLAAQVGLNLTTGKCEAAASAGIDISPASKATFEFTRDAEETKGMLTLSFKFG